MQVSACVCVCVQARKHVSHACTRALGWVRHCAGACWCEVLGACGGSRRVKVRSNAQPMSAAAPPYPRLPDLNSLT